jgi:hypothetical protein
MPDHILCILFGRKKLERRNMMKVLIKKTSIFILLFILLLFSNHLLFAKDILDKDKLPNNLQTVIKKAVRSDQPQLLSLFDTLIPPDLNISDLEPSDEIVELLSSLLSENFPWIDGIDVYSFITCQNIVPPSPGEQPPFEPVESGKDAYIYPDVGLQLEWLTMWGMDDGDTIYIREGSFTDNIRAYSGGDGYKRIHVRGMGKTLSTLNGYVWVGPGSTVRDLKIVNPHNEVSLAAVPGPVIVSNVMVIGGNVGMTAGAAGGMQTPVDAPISVHCSQFMASTFIGMHLGDVQWGFPVSNSIIDRVIISNQPGSGLTIEGDYIIIDKSTVYDVGDNGIYVLGDGAEIKNSYIIENGKPNGMGFNSGTGLSIVGDHAILSDMEFDQAGLGHITVYGDHFSIKDSTLTNGGNLGINIHGMSANVKNVNISDLTSLYNKGIHIGEYSDGFSISDSSFENMRIGIFIDCSSGQLINNTFTNISYQDVLENVCDNGGGPGELPGMGDDRPIGHDINLPPFLRDANSFMKKAEEPYRQRINNRLYLNPGPDISTDPDIEVTPLEYDFGEVVIGTSKKVVIFINNVGTSTLTINGLYWDKWSGDEIVSDVIISAFTITLPETPITPERPVFLIPGEILEVEITYLPSQVGYSSRILNIYYITDKDESLVQVRLEGTGVEK